MRWDDLFADLEAQLEADHLEELWSEVADRSRRELARVHLADRLVSQRGMPISVALLGAGVIGGRLADVGAGWLLIEEEGRGPALVPSGACMWFEPLSRMVSPPSDQVLIRRLTLTYALRGLAMRRAPVRVTLVDGSERHGTVDRAHADHLDLAEHGPEDFRRAASVRAIRSIPFAALAVVRAAR
jgi:hypothetical protein